MAYKRKDHFYQMAKSEGKSSRAAYKITEINSKYNLIKPNNTVLDLGAWPGGWLIELSKIVGNHGLIIGIDIVNVDIHLPENTKFIEGDIFDSASIEKIIDYAGKSIDTIVSDLAPKLTGISFRDTAKWEELVLTALEIADKTLKDGGNIIIKAFSSPEADNIRNSMKNKFERVQVFRPKASRKGSSEFYLIGKNYKR